jgi:hypothetical protein
MDTQKNREDQRLCFRNEHFQVKQLIGLMRQAPVIEVKREDLNPCGPAAEVIFRVSYAPAAPELHYGEVAFFKQEGKFTILLGQSTVQTALEQGAATIKGRLISSPGMKKARIFTNPTPDVPDQTSPPREPLRSPEYLARKDYGRPDRTERPAREDSRPYGAHRKTHPNSSGTIARRDFK